MGSSMIQLTNAVERYNKIILAELKEGGVICWIAGGALRDYFLPNQENYDRAAAYFKGKEAKVIWESDNGMKVRYKRRIYDLIKIHFAGPQETIDSFDFTACQLACDGNKMFVGPTTFMDLAKRQLMINNITYPPSTLSRAFKYHHKGFSICQGEMRKIVEAIQGMPKPEPKPQEGGDPGASASDEPIPPSGGNDSEFFRGID
jgi:hypothetical protein